MQVLLLGDAHGCWWRVSEAIDEARRRHGIGAAIQVGVVVGSLNARRGEIAEIAPLPGGAATVRASAPLAELLGYAVALRSLTQGRGACTLEPDGLRPVPARGRT